MTDIEKILPNFNCKGTYCSAEKCNSGHINVTMRVTFDNAGEKKDYILQEINSNVFKDVDALMDNIFNVTSHLRSKIRSEGGNENRETLHFIKTKAGGSYYRAKDGRAYRMYELVENSVSHNIGSRALMYQSGVAFGRFQRRLSDFPAENLNETIVNFHNTKLRYEKEFLPAVANDAVDRKSGCEPEIDFVNRRKGEFSRLTDLAATGEIPTRVTHNDTKLNNIVFDADTDEAVCVIDLDTVMPGLLLYDFGDSIRFGANTAAEDEKDLSKVNISLENFEAYARGFLSEAKNTLTKAESENLVFSAWLMTMEVGMRFLTDYLSGDVYFDTHYDSHNLVRAKNQFKLASEIENHSPQMEKIITSILGG